MKDLKLLFVYNSAPMPQTRLKTLSAWKTLSQEVKVLFAYPKNYKRTTLDRVLHKIKMPRDANNINISIHKTDFLIHTIVAIGIPGGIHHSCLFFFYK